MLNTPVVETPGTPGAVSDLGGPPPDTSKMSSTPTPAIEVDPIDQNPSPKLGNFGNILKKVYQFVAPLGEMVEHAVRNINH